MTISIKVGDDSVMDPKQSAQLDPKLQEAYNRVMGTPTPPATPAPSVTPTPAAVITPPTIQPTIPSPNTPADVATPGPAPVVMPHSTETVRIGGSTPVEVTAVQTSGGVVANSGKKGISPIILILGAVVFLVVYTIFWVKFLNVPLPFVNQ